MPFWTLDKKAELIAQIAKKLNMNKVEIYHPDSEYRVKFHKMISFLASVREAQRTSPRSAKTAKLERQLDAAIAHYLTPMPKDA